MKPLTEIKKENEKYEMENQDRLRIHTTTERLRIKRREEIER